MTEEYPKNNISKIKKVAVVKCPSYQQAEVDRAERTNKPKSL